MTKKSSSLVVGEDGSVLGLLDFLKTSAALARELRNPASTLADRPIGFVILQILTGSDNLDPNEKAALKKILGSKNGVSNAPFSVKLRSLVRNGIGSFDKDLAEFLFLSLNDAEGESYKISLFDLSKTSNFTDPVLKLEGKGSSFIKIRAGQYEGNIYRPLSKDSLLLISSFSGTVYASAGLSKAVPIGAVTLTPSIGIEANGGAHIDMAFEGRKSASVAATALGGLNLLDDALSPENLLRSLLAPPATQQVRLHHYRFKTNYGLTGRAGLDVGIAAPGNTIPFTGAINIGVSYGLFGGYEFSLGSASGPNNDPIARLDIRTDRGTRKNFAVSAQLSFDLADATNKVADRLDEIDSEFKSARKKLQALADFDQHLNNAAKEILNLITEDDELAAAVLASLGIGPQGSENLRDYLKNQIIGGIKATGLLNDDLVSDREIAELVAYDLLNLSPDVRFVRRLTDVISDNIGNLRSEISNSIKSNLEKKTNNAGKILEEITGKFGNKINTAKDKIETKIQKVKNALDVIEKTVADIIDRLRDPDKNTLSLALTYEKMKSREQAVASQIHIQDTPDGLAHGSEIIKSLFLASEDKINSSISHALSKPGIHVEAFKDTKILKTGAKTTTAFQFLGVNLNSLDSIGSTTTIVDDKLGETRSAEAQGNLKFRVGNRQAAIDVLLRGTSDVKSVAANLKIHLGQFDSHIERNEISNIIEVYSYFSKSGLMNEEASLKLSEYLEQQTSAGLNDVFVGASLVLTGDMLAKPFLEIAPVQASLSLGERMRTILRNPPVIETALKKRIRSLMSDYQHFEFEAGYRPDRYLISDTSEELASDLCKALFTLAVHFYDSEWVNDPASGNGQAPIMTIGDRGALYSFDEYPNAILYALDPWIKARDNSRNPVANGPMCLLLILRDLFATDRTPIVIGTVSRTLKVGPKTRKIERTFG